MLSLLARLHCISVPEKAIWVQSCKVPVEWAAPEGKDSILKLATKSEFISKDLRTLFHLD